MIFQPFSFGNFYCFSLPACLYYSYVNLVIQGLVKYKKWRNDNISVVNYSLNHYNYKTNYEAMLHKFSTNLPLDFLNLYYFLLIAKLALQNVSLNHNWHFNHEIYLNTKNNSTFIGYTWSDILKIIKLKF